MKSASANSATPRRSSRARWVRWGMLAWALAIAAWLGIREWREHTAVQTATALQESFQNDTRFAEVKVVLSANADLTILAPDYLAVADRAELDRQVAQRAPGAKVAYRAATPASKLPPPRPLPDDKFLGLRDDESRKIGDTTPEAAVGGVTDLTTVSPREYTDYESALAKGVVKAHATRGGFIYYAVEEGRHVPFGGGTSAWVFVTERYKAKLPGKTAGESDGAPR